MLLSFQGFGSVLGPLTLGPKIVKGQSTMRMAALAGYITAGCGYMLFSQSLSIPLAGLFLVLAHGGSALVWVCSTTLLHLNTDHRFLGRVFAADMGLFMGTASVSTYCMGYVLDLGVPGRTGAFWLGVALLGPAVVWAFSLQRFRRDAPVSNQGR